LAHRCRSRYRVEPNNILLLLLCFFVLPLTYSITEPPSLNLNQGKLSLGLRAPIATAYGTKNQNKKLDRLRVLLDYYRRHFLALKRINMAIAPIIPPKTKSTWIGNPPDDVCAPSGASDVTTANHEPPDSWAFE
jgi:hypothetical protein